MSSSDPNYIHQFTLEDVIEEEKAYAEGKPHKYRPVNRKVVKVEHGKINEYLYKQCGALKDDYLQCDRKTRHWQQLLDNPCEKFKVRYEQCKNYSEIYWHLMHEPARRLHNAKTDRISEEIQMGKIREMSRGMDKATLDKYKRYYGLDKVSDRGPLYADEGEDF